MAQQKKPTQEGSIKATVTTNGEEHIGFEPVKQILVQSERYQLGTRVFAKGNACAECHLDPDYLISGLHAKYPSFADLKGFMKVGHQRYFTMAQEMPEAELMEIYRTLK